MDPLKNAWSKFRSWPMWVQVTCWVVLGVAVLASAIDPDDETATVASDSTTTVPAPVTTTAPSTTTSTVDAAFVRAEASRLCRDAAAASVEQTPGIENELTDENIDALVELGTSSFVEGVEGTPGGDIAIEACQEATRAYFLEVRSTTTTEPPGPATSFTDGTYEVGVDIEAGTYRTANEGGGFCYVDVRDSVGQDAGFIDQQVGEGPKIIQPTEGTFVNSSGCGDWAQS